MAAASDSPAVLWREPGDGEPFPPLRALAQVLTAVADLRADLEHEGMRAATEQVECADPPLGLMPGLDGLDAAVRAINAELQRFDAWVSWAAAPREERGPPPPRPDLVWAVRRLGLRGAFVLTVLRQWWRDALANAEAMDAAARALAQGRATVTHDDFPSVVAVPCKPNGRGA